ncbi:CDP-glycerol glycerophosphotransferase family protein, partial [Helicobacter typhlonius]|uniref:CDP-glycerol glycerophosphotransferase family protein n=1 Tax=Helicobacter typhlonius TaxID=76936 RepID=UPI002FE3A1FA
MEFKGKNNPSLANPLYAEDLDESFCIIDIRYPEDYALCHIKDSLQLNNPYDVYAHIKKNPNQIFIYSNLGFRDNVRAVYDYLIENGYNKKFKIVCSLNDYKRYRHCAPSNVKFVGNFTGLFKFFRSKFCFYCFGKYPVKPSDKQAVINLWHGMPIKRIGNMEQGNEKT